MVMDVESFEDEEESRDVRDSGKKSADLEFERVKEPVKEPVREPVKEPIKLPTPINK